MDRHPEADALLLDHLDLTGSTIVDLGASDGSTSLDLIRRLPAFQAYVIADLHMNVAAIPVRRHTLLYDGNGECILIFSRRWVVWPQLSRIVRLLYRPLLAAATYRAERRRTIPLVNPEVRSLMATDGRITCRVHDLFQPWVDQQPDVIKIANLLRFVYFDADAISCGLSALLAGLPEGGHLFMVENPFPNERGTRAGLYRRHGDRFVIHATTEEPPEIHSLVLQAGLPTDRQQAVSI